MPRAPAFETAAANFGVDTPPIPASWIGTEQPTKAVNGVCFTFRPSQ
jgi:hypothetical protein